MSRNIFLVAVLRLFYRRNIMANPRSRTTLQPSAAPSRPRIRAGRKTCKKEPCCATFVSDVYLPHIRLRKRSWEVDERILRQHILPTFGSCPLESIQRASVEIWLYALARQGLAPATCNRILSVFKSLCTLAVSHDVLLFSPCASIQPFRILQLRERHLTTDEAHRLMQALNSSSRQEARALQLLLLTGARKSEILRAKWEYVRLEQRRLTVPLSKSNKPRHITLSDEAAAIIRNLPRRPGCPWLFPGHAPGRPLSDLYLFWDHLRQKLGLSDVRIHDLRHTFASILVNAGHSLYEVQRLLGHSDPRTTMRYAHLEQNSLLIAAGTVSTFLNSERTSEDKNSPIPDNA